MPDPVEAIVAAYVEAADGDRDEAFRRAVCDALTDLTEAERRTERAERMVSHGYVRGEIHRPNEVKADRGQSWSAGSLAFRSGT